MREEVKREEKVAKRRVGGKGESAEKNTKEMKNKDMVGIN